MEMTHTQKTARPAPLGTLTVVESDYALVGAKILADMRAEHVRALVSMTESTARRILHCAGNNPLAIDPTSVHFALVTLGAK